MKITYVTSVDRMDEIHREFDAAAADDLARALFAWAEHTALEVTNLRELPGTQLDASAYAADERQRSWLAEAGYRRTRTWLQMSRPVAAETRITPRHRSGWRSAKCSADGPPAETAATMARSMPRASSRAG